MENKDIYTFGKNLRLSIKKNAEEIVPLLFNEKQETENSLNDIELIEVTSNRNILEDVELIETIIDETVLKEASRNGDIKIGEILQGIEMEPKIVKNILKTTKMMTEISDRQTTYYYDYPPRKKFEVKGGYKKSLEKGARLNEVKVFNLFFRFKNDKADGSATALMYRPLSTNEEWILLLPDDTKMTIEIESTVFRKTLDRMLENSLITKEHYDNYKITLEENLKLLNVHERCAQSLMHEYGHVLHWRIFDQIAAQNPEKKLYHSDIYEWFEEHGYVENIDKRARLKGLNCYTQIQDMKEALVEDYRIYLNMKQNHGMFTLPNRITHLGDFANPKLLEEGVSIMEKMLKPALNGTLPASQRTGSSSQELNTVNYAARAWHRAETSAWQPGTPSMSKSDRKEIIQELREREERTANLYV